jgi:hypothetical protein
MVGVVVVVTCVAGVVEVGVEAGCVRAGCVVGFAV